MREGRCNQKHYKTQFPDSAAGAIFRASDETRVTERGRSMRFRVDINRPPSGRKEKESLVSVTQNGFRVINAAKRMQRNRAWMRDSGQLNKCCTIHHSNHEICV